jgi:dihydrofolate reductase
MSKVVLNLAMSLDGYIARENGSVDWLDNLDTDGSDLGFSSFLDNVGTIITGRISYEDTKKLSDGNWPFKNKETYVITKGSYENEDRVYFVKGDLINLIKDLKRNKQNDIWLFGGGSLIKCFREYNLIDEYIITIIPILLGGGKRLFQATLDNNELELIQVVKCKNIVQLHYTSKTIEKETF